MNITCNTLQHQWENDSFKILQEVMELLPALMCISVISLSLINKLTHCFFLLFFLRQMKDSLLNLQRGIGLRDYSSEAEEKRSRYHWHTTTRPWGHAVQYRTCFVCEPVCRQQQDRERGQRGRRDQQWAGPIDTKRGTVVSSAQRLKPPGGGNHGQKVPPITHRNWAVPQHHWGIVGRCETCSFSAPVG